MRLDAAGIVRPARRQTFPTVSSGSPVPDPTLRTGLVRKHRPPFSRFASPPSECRAGPESLLCTFRSECLSLLPQTSNYEYRLVRKRHFRTGSQPPAGPVARRQPAPLHDKLCSFDCIYCECGWGKPGAKPRFNSRETVRRLLREKLTEMVAAGTPPDVITFAGNGEPTMHPEFGGVIDDTIAVRDELCPSAKISVLSNATMIGRETVREALLKADNNILKLDSAFDETVRLVDRPKGAYSVRQTVEAMKLFDGRLIVQTMFLRGHARRAAGRQHDRAGGVGLALADRGDQSPQRDGLHDRPRHPGRRPAQSVRRGAPPDRRTGRAPRHPLLGGRITRPNTQIHRI